ncbi:MAG: PIN domain-containing protein [Chloroflexota bacterium]|nr:PIN domain-containing protein [Chloroflexota bacterium]
MTVPYIDTDALIRFLTGDDPVKQADVRALLRRVANGDLIVAAPDTVIADAVYVLSSRRLYDLPRAQVQALLTPLVQLHGFHLDNRRQVLRALDLFGATNLDFGDALIVASMEHAGSRTLYSYDRDFDRIPTVERIPPPSTA